MNMRPSDAHIQYGLLLNPWDQWGEFGVRPKIYEESQHIKVAMLCGEIQRTLALRAPTIKTMIVGIYVIHVSLRVIFKHLFHFCNTFRATAKFINSSRSIHTLIYIWRIFLNASFLQSHLFDKVATKLIQSGLYLHFRGARVGMRWYWGWKCSVHTLRAS